MWCHLDVSRASEDTNRRMLRARDAMDRHYAEPLDVPALARIAQSLQDGTGDFQHNRELLARDLAVCVENLQFHDRLTQQLTQVRNLLASLAFSEMYLDSTGRLLPGDTETWQVLLENLRARFTSDSHRILFNLLLPGAGPRTSAPSLHANEGSVELF